jgi:hypothetical protein
MQLAITTAIRVAIIASTSLAYALSGCDRQPSGSSISPAQDPPMPTSGEMTQAGERFDLADFSITLPDSMAAVDLSSDDFAALSTAMRSKFEARNLDAMSQMVERYRASGRFKFFAADLTADDPSFLDNVNVIVSRAPARMTQDQAASMSERSLPEIGATLMRRDRFTSASCTFDRLHSHFAETGAESVAYVLIRSGKLYVITFTAKADRAGPFFGQASEIMSNFTAR